MTAGGRGDDPEAVGTMKGIRGSEPQGIVSDSF